MVIFICQVQSTLEQQTKLRIPGKRRGGVAWGGGGQTTVRFFAFTTQPIFSNKTEPFGTLGLSLILVFILVFNVILMKYVT